LTDEGAVKGDEIGNAAGENQHVVRVSIAYSQSMARFLAGQGGGWGEMIMGRFQKRWI
jgi:hypothetical protein